MAKKGGKVGLNLSRYYLIKILLKDANISSKRLKIDLDANDQQNSKNPVKPENWMYVAIKFLCDVLNAFLEKFLCISVFKRKFRRSWTLSMASNHSLHI